MTPWCKLRIFDLYGKLYFDKVQRRPRTKIYKKYSILFYKNDHRSQERRSIKEKIKKIKLRKNKSSLYIKDIRVSEKKTYEKLMQQVDYRGATASKNILFCPL